MCVCVCVREREREILKTLFCKDFNGGSERERERERLLMKLEVVE